MRLAEQNVSPQHCFVFSTGALHTVLASRASYNGCPYSLYNQLRHFKRGWHRARGGTWLLTGSGINRRRWVAQQRARQSSRQNNGQSRGRIRVAGEVGLGFCRKGIATG